MSLELAKRKYKIYKWLHLSLLIFTIVFFLYIITPQTNINNNLITFFGVNWLPLIIIIIILNNKRRYYKKLIYDLEIREISIRETINDKHLK
jgi:hypothetical protein